MNHRLLSNKSFSQLPQFGLSAGGTVFCAVAGLWVATAIQDPTSEGITVHVVSDVVRKGNFDPWTQPIVIRVDAEHRYYLHSKLIPLQDIPAALARSFKARPNWTVYVEGDLDSTYGDVVQAADAVRSARGRVVLLTHTIR